MTTINDITDLIRLLQEDPAWAEALRNVLLTKELLELPETFAAFATETRENFRTVNRRLGSLEDGQARLEDGQAKLQDGQAEMRADIGKLQEGQAEMRADITKLQEGQAKLQDGQTEMRADITKLQEGQARLEDGQTEMRADITKLQEGQAGMRADITKLEAGQTEMRADITKLEAGQAKLEAGQARLEAGQARLEAGQARMGGDLSRLTGHDYETRAARRAPSMTADQLNLTSIETLFTTGNPQYLDALALNAQLQGVITRNENTELTNTDLILRGEGPGTPDFQMLGEISITIQERDLIRAVNRAAILEKATGVRTQPILIGTAIEEGLDTGDILFLEVPDIG